MAIEIQRVDLELDMVPKSCKSKYTPGSIEIVFRRGVLTFACSITQGCHEHFCCHSLIKQLSQSVISSQQFIVLLRFKKCLSYNESRILCRVARPLGPANINTCFYNKNYIGFVPN